MRSYIYNKNSVIGSQAEHCGMRTYFFSADTQEDMNGWIRAMNQAALMQQSHTIKRLVLLYRVGFTPFIVWASAHTNILPSIKHSSLHDTGCVMRCYHKMNLGITVFLQTVLFKMCYCVMSSTVLHCTVFIIEICCGHGLHSQQVQICPSVQGHNHACSVCVCLCVYVCVCMCAASAVRYK